MTMASSKLQRQDLEDMEPNLAANCFRLLSPEIEQSFRSCEENIPEDDGTNNKIILGRKSKQAKKERKTLELVKLICKHWSHLTFWISKKKGKIDFREILPFKIDISKSLKNSICLMKFNVCSLENDELIPLLEYMFDDLEMISELKLDYGTLHSFLLAVQEKYKENPYHNFHHGFCVTQTLYVLIKQCNLKSYLPTQSLIALLVACICHDIGHPGVTNSYHVNSNSELVNLYGSVSTLEYHHIAITQGILNNEDTNIFQFIDHDEYDEIWKKMKLLILATDISKHEGVLENFKNYQKSFNFCNELHRISLEEIIIKACDVSNSARPYKTSLKLTKQLFCEFFEQAALERREGLPVLEIADKSKVDIVTTLISFLVNVPIPLFENLAKLFQPINETMLIPSTNNLKLFKKVKEEKFNRDIFDEKHS